MLILPKETEKDIRITKEKLYKERDANSALRRIIVNQIKSARLRNILNADTLNVASGKSVEAILVIEIALAVKDPDERALVEIDKAFPYPVLFLLEYDGKYRARISYKEMTPKSFGGKARVLVSATYQTEWMKFEDLPCRLDGFDLDALYENFVRQIAGKRLQAREEGSLQEDVERDKIKKKLIREINALTKKIQNEKQFNRQVELHKKQKALEKELNELEK